MVAGPRLSSKNSIAILQELVEVSLSAMKSFCQYPLLLIFTVLLPCLPSLARGIEDWTLEDVLAKVAESNGGAESIQGVTNARIRGKVDNPDGGYEFLLLKKRPDKMRLRLMFPGRSIETGYDGIAGWQRIIQGSSQKVTALSGDELSQLRLEVDFDGPLIGEPAPGIDRRLDRIERIDRVDYFVIEIKRAGIVAEHFVDSRTFRELQVVHRQLKDDGTELVRTTRYYEYSKFGGIWVAMRSERTLPDGRIETIRVEEVEVDPGILDLVFGMPSE